MNGLRRAPPSALNARSSLLASLPATPHLVLPAWPLVSLQLPLPAPYPAIESQHISTPSHPRELLSEGAHNSAGSPSFPRHLSSSQPPRGKTTRNKPNAKTRWRPRLPLHVTPRSPSALALETWGSDLQNRRGAGHVSVSRRSLGAQHHPKVTWASSPAYSPIPDRLILEWIEWSCLQANPELALACH